MDEFDKKIELIFAIICNVGLIFLSLYVLYIKGINFITIGSVCVTICMLIYLIKKIKECFK